MGETPQKCPFTSQRLHPMQYIPWTHMTQHPQMHFNWFNHFCTAHGTESPNFTMCVKTQLMRDLKNQSFDSPIFHRCLSLYHCGQVVGTLVRNHNVTWCNRCMCMKHLEWCANCGDTTASYNQCTGNAGYTVDAQDLSSV